MGKKAKPEDWIRLAEVLSSKLVALSDDREFNRKLEAAVGELEAVATIDDLSNLVQLLHTFIIRKRKDPRWLGALGAASLVMLGGLVQLGVAEIEHAIHPAEVAAHEIVASCESALAISGGGSAVVEAMAEGRLGGLKGQAEAQAVSPPAVHEAGRVTGTTADPGSSRGLKIDNQGDPIINVRSGLPGQEEPYDLTLGQVPEGSGDAPVDQTVEAQPAELNITAQPMKAVVGDPPDEPSDQTPLERLRRQEAERQRALDADRQALQEREAREAEVTDELARERVAYAAHSGDQPEDVPPSVGGMPDPINPLGLPEHLNDPRRFDDEAAGRTIRVEINDGIGVTDEARSEVPLVDGGGDEE